MPRRNAMNMTRQAKGQQTKERLLEEALRLFALKGPDAVGTRELAGAAGTNVASIAFHFGNKEGLYSAVIEAVAGELATIHQRALAAAREASNEAGEDAARRAGRVMAGLVTALLTSNRSQWMSLLLQREFIAPTPSFEKIYTRAIEPTLSAISRLVAEATGQDGGGRDTTVLAYAVFIMASAFARNKITFLRFAGLTEYAPEDVAAISRVLAAFVESGLGRPV